jgi:crotonobetainyl-CoA:carnitine CoA-transferase CaiB-like acyl-CoA transferase
MGTDKSLSGIKVLDFTRTVAGPFGSMILADLGADVIKIEQADGGDDSRRLPPSWNGESAAFLALNRNKKSIVLDLKSEEDRGYIIQLVESCDVVMESFRPGVMERLQLGFDVLKLHNPNLIYCSVSAFGRGPLGRSMPGYDALLQAFSGIMKATGHHGNPPTRLAPSVIDLNTGMWAAIQILAALARSRAEPGPKRLEVTLVDAAFNLMCHQFIGFLATGEIPSPQGSGSPVAAPYEVFRAKDGDLLIAAGNDRLFQRLCDTLGLDELTTDPRFLGMTNRVQNRAVLHQLLENVLLTETVAKWVERLTDAGVPAGPVQDIKQAAEHAIVAERRLFVPCEGTTRNPKLKLLRLPLGDDIGSFREPPMLGEHTDEVLRAFGIHKR